MKRIHLSFRAWLVSLAALLAALPACADVTLDQLEFTEVAGGYSVTKKSGETLEGALVIPDTYGGKPVVKIGKGAFWYCSGLTSVHIGDKVTNIGNYAFQHCSGLTSITIPDAVTTIGSAAFGWCSSLTSVNIPDAVTTIETSTFRDCPGLTSVNIPDAVTTIGQMAFYGCSGLTSVNIPDAVTTIGEDAFKGCSSLASIILPTGIDFRYVNSNSFSSSGLRKVYVLAKKLYYSFDYSDYFPRGCTIYAKSGVLSSNFISYNRESRNQKACTILDNNDSYAINDTLTTFNSIKFFLERIPRYEGDPLEAPAGLQSIHVEYNGASLSANKEGIYELNNLTPGQHFPITIKGKYTYDEDVVEKHDTYSLYTEYPDLRIKVLAIRQASVDFQITTLTNIRPKKMGCSGYSGYSTDKITPLDNNSGYTAIVSVKDLRPQYSSTFYPSVSYDGENWVSQNYYDDTKNEYGTRSRDVTTHSTSPSLSLTEVSATSIHCKAKYTLEDAEITSTKLTIDGNSYDGNELILTGLEPNSTHTATYTIVASGVKEEASVKFTTPALEFKMLTPKVVNSTTAVVCAETNISDDETGTGFEWRKVDAPDVVPSKSGAGRVYDGTLEGRLNNLSSDSYYKVRPFYTSAAGRTYYGEWIGFDPSDFSYFEPTVHTYPVTGTTHNSARLKGYVMAGTDDIEEQGFQYWPANAEHSQARYALAATTTAGDMTTVLASGQVMTAELNDLTPNTSYRYRAFVRTKGGTTYGEEQSFTTEADLTAVGGIEAETAEVIIIGYFDLKGRRYDMPQKGLNIVRYSDGTSRKLMVR